MVKVNITGNAPVHKLSYGRGIYIVTRKMADRLLEAGVAEELETIKEAVQTSDNKTTSKKRKKR